MNNNNGRTVATTGQCRHIKADRSRCRANSRHNSNYCFFHDPDSAVERENARSNGGKERSRRAAVLPAETPDKPLESASDVTILLAETINQVRRGEIDPRISNAVGYLAGILLKAKENQEIEQRIAHLESILAGQQMKPQQYLDPNQDAESFEFVNSESGG